MSRDSAIQVIIEKALKLGIEEDLILANITLLISQEEQTKTQSEKLVGTIIVDLAESAKKVGHEHASLSLSNFLETEINERQLTMLSKLLEQEGIQIYRSHYGQHEVEYMGYRREF